MVYVNICLAIKIYLYYGYESKPWDPDGTFK